MAVVLNQQATIVCDTSDEYTTQSNLQSSIYGVGPADGTYTVNGEQITFASAAKTITFIRNGTPY